ncbi:hypothetical protein [Roseobacter sp. HKCCA0434]|nr:hypothetical protein [Roseobacter sp. HKCCA0434]
MPLTSRVCDIAKALARARDHFALPTPFVLDTLAPCEETMEGFRLL